MAQDMDNNNLPMVNNPGSPRVIYPHLETQCHWQRRINTEGHYFYYRPNGGRPASVFASVNIVHLAFFCSVYPEAMAAEVAAYLFSIHGHFLNPPQFYDPAQITPAEQELGLSCKQSVQTACQAHMPRVINWHQNYWTLPYPLGIADVPARDMIDIDEAVINSIHVQCHYGKAFVLM